MNQSADTALPALFAHTLRKEWGLGILSGENQGKRSYLFENGAERTMAVGFHGLMREVEQPDHDQQVIYARLRAVLAAREEGKPPTTTKTSGPTFLEQLDRLHQTYPAGLLDPAFATEVRAERDRAVERAQTELSAKALDALLNGQKFQDLWDLVRGVVNEAGVVPTAARIPAKSVSDPRALATAVRELLHGTGAHEQRFDRYVAAFSATYGQPSSWEAATALSALVHPKQHVCVDPTTFKKQMKTLSSRSSIASQPNGADYSRLLGAARVVANRLGEQGEMPRDLLDVYDFVRFTLKAASKKRAATAKAKKPAAEPSESESSDSSDD